MLKIQTTDKPLVSRNICMCAKSLQSCLTLYNSMNYSLPVSSVHGILQASILEWVAVPFSRGSSWPRAQTLGLLHCRQILYHLSHQGCNPGGLDDKESTGNAGDPGSIPGSGRSPGEGNGNPFQYSCPENPMERGVWQATVQRVAKSWTWLSD